MLGRQSNTRVYALDTPSDANGNSPYRHICHDNSDQLSPTKWMLESGYNQYAAKKTWPNFRCDWCPPKRLPISDHPDGAFPGELLSQHAVDVLHDALSFSGDFFPLQMVSGPYPYWLYMNWAIVDVLDVDKSKFWGPQVSSAVFMPNIILPFAFHIPQDHRLLVTDIIKNIVEENNLTGFELALIGECV